MKNKRGKRALSPFSLLIGIPSRNNASTISHVVEICAEGLGQYFPDSKALIFNSDCGSTDGTRQAVLDVRLPANVTSMATECKGVSGKGFAVREIFRKMLDTGAGAAAIVDSDLRSIAPAWVDKLLRPVLDGDFDFVAPFYLRHKYDGTITNNIAYPMTASLYGKRIRQPIGGEFAFSPALAEEYIRVADWDSAAGRFGIDIFMTTVAAAGGRRIAQAALGAKIHDPKDPASSLGPMFKQVVGTLFEMMRTYEGAWQKCKSVEDVPVIGTAPETAMEPVSVNTSKLYDAFQKGWKEYAEGYRKLLRPQVFSEIGNLSSLSEKEFSFPAACWAKTVHDFACAFARDRGARDRILEAMLPLYFARTLAFVNETLEMDSAGAERLIEQQALIFKKEKPTLINRWPR